MWLMLPSGPAAWGGAALGALARGASERAPPPSCCAAAPETELPVTLRECALKGRGVFAAAALAEGGFVCEYVGDVLSLAEVEEVYGGDSEPEYLFALPHGAQQTAHLYLDAAKSEHWSRYLNHAEEASCLVQAVVGEESCDGSRTGGGSGVGRNAGARLAIRAARQIAVGEELTFDYGLRSPTPHFSHMWRPHFDFSHMSEISFCFFLATGRRALSTLRPAQIRGESS